MRTNLWTELISVFSPRLLTDTFCPITLMLSNARVLSVNQLPRAECSLYESLSYGIGSCSLNKGILGKRWYSTRDLVKTYRQGRMCFVYH